MKFYIASGLTRAKEVQEVASALKQRGHTHTYDWTVHGDVREQGANRLTRVAQNEVNAVLESDLVLIMLPGGNGTHTELGISVADCIARPEKNKQVWIWSENGEHFQANGNTCAFYYHPCVRHFTSLASIIEAVTVEFSEVRIL